MFPEMTLNIHDYETCRPGEDLFWGLLNYPNIHEYPKHLSSAAIRLSYAIKQAIMMGSLASLV